METKNGELKIEKGIPIPADPRGRPGTISVVMRAMKVGDSVYLDGANSRKNGAIYLGKGNYTSRKEKQGFRIWRTK